MRPSAHLSWDELACWNRLGREWNGHAPSALIAAYPAVWREARAIQLVATFEEIRSRLGDHPMVVNSAYRRNDYNRAVGGAAMSQHVLGRALDLRHATVKPKAFFDEVRELYAEGFLPFLGGIGRYKTFVHIDVRPRVNNRLAVWTGSSEGA